MVIGQGCRQVVGRHEVTAPIHAERAQIGFIAVGQPSRAMAPKNQAIMVGGKGLGDLSQHLAQPLGCR